MAENVLEVSDSEFDELVLKSSTPVLVDFWAPWCGPCLQLSPVIEQLAKELGEKVKIVKVNVDENRQSAAKYNVQSIPNLILFKDGQVKSQRTGAAPKPELEKMIKSALA